MYRSVTIGMVALAVIMSSFGFAQEQKVVPSLPSCIVERLNDPALMAHGEAKIYSGKYLDAILMPLGGIGAGSMKLRAGLKKRSTIVHNCLRPDRTKPSRY